jgi:hypothetical protein
MFNKNDEFVQFLNLNSNHDISQIEFELLLNVIWWSIYIRFIMMVK